MINPNRVKLLKVFKALNELKRNYEVFSTPDFDYDLAGTGKRIRLNNSDKNAVIIGNFGVEDIMLNPGFQHTGTWYDYFTGEIISVDDVNNQFLLSPGEYRIYTDFQLPTPDLSATMYIGIEEDLTDITLSVYPNPTKDLVFISGGLTNVDFKIYDSFGRLIQIGRGNTINLKNYKNGVYMVKVEIKEQFKTFMVYKE